MILETEIIRGWQIYVYRALNGKMKRPMLLILSTEVYSLHLDISGVIMEKENTSYSLRFTRMNFGIYGELMTFERLVINALRLENRINCIINLDDNLIFEIITYFYQYAS